MALEVFFTVDTECWPAGFANDRETLSDAVERDIWGRTPRGDFGIGFMGTRLREHGLTGTFFVEALQCGADADRLLADSVAGLQREDQDVQLHVHPEWLSHLPELEVPVPVQNLHQLNYDHQLLVLGVALANLRRAGASRVRAFRAGNYGANADTLRALRHLGLEFDSSYNVAFAGGQCQIEAPSAAIDPYELEGLCELPIAHFEDLPGHRRPAQLCACSFGEMRNALLRAREANHSTFVIVSHSFELLNGSRNGPDRIVTRRFEQLCRFLADHPEDFQMRGFAAYDPGRLRAKAPDSSLRSNPPRTLKRVGEQAFRRLLPREAVRSSSGAPWVVESVALDAPLFAGLGVKARPVVQVWQGDSARAQPLDAGFGQRAFARLPSYVDGLFVPDHPFDGVPPMLQLAPDHVAYVVRTREPSTSDPATAVGDLLILRRSLSVTMRAGAAIALRVGLGRLGIESAPIRRQGSARGMP